MVALLDFPRSKDGRRTMAQETFGSRLKRLREAAGLTQQQLADAVGMHRFGVSKLERDEYGPTWVTVLAIAKVLNVNCTVFEDAIVPGKEEKPPQRKGRPPKSAPAPEAPADAGEPAPSGEKDAPPAPLPPPQEKPTGRKPRRPRGG